MENSIPLARPRQQAAAAVSGLLAANRLHGGVLRQADAGTCIRSKGT
jgi:hypothetical protein